jgi:hypothetical protein
MFSMFHNTTLATIVAGLGLVAAGGAQAVPITYQLSGASATFTSPSATVSVTGDFKFDPSGPTLDAVDITATETSGSGVLPGTSVEFTMPFQGLPSQIIALNSAAPAEILIGFAAALGSAPAVINDVRFEIASGVNIATSVTGSAIPALEPNTLALLGGAIGLFVARRGLRSRAR